MLKKINILIVAVSLLFLIGCDKEEAKNAEMNPKFHNLSPEVQQELRSEVEDSGTLDADRSTSIFGSATGGDTSVVASSDLEKNVKNLPGGGFVIEGMPVHRQGRADPFDGNKTPKYAGAYCGVVSLQMVLAYHGKKVAQDDLGFTKQDGTRIPVTASHKGQMYLRGVGTDHGKAPGVAKHYGFANSTQRSYSSQQSGISELKKLIKQGRPQIINIDGDISYKGGYPTANQSAYSRTTKGHVIVLKGFTGSGDAIVNDPAVGSRIMTKSSFEKIWSSSTKSGRNRLNSVDVAA